MKRTFTREDGTQEVVEGTAEELAEYERRLREGLPLPLPANESTKKPGVLHGASLDGIPLTDAECEYIRLIRGLVEQAKSPVVKPWDYEPSWPYAKPIWIVSCSICAGVGCNGECYQPQWVTITSTDSALKG